MKTHLLLFFLFLPLVGCNSHLNVCFDIEDKTVTHAEFEACKNSYSLEKNFDDLWHNPERMLNCESLGLLTLHSPTGFRTYDTGYLAGFDNSRYAIISKSNFRNHDPSILVDTDDTYKEVYVKKSRWHWGVENGLLPCERTVFETQK